MVGYQDFAQEGEEQAITWPEFTMKYSNSAQTVRVGPEQVNLVLNYNLTYRSSNNWREDITAATPVDTQWGTFSPAGSYTEVNGDQLTTYDAAFDHTMVEIIPDDTTQIPHANFYPHGMEKLESQNYYGQEAEEAPTGVKVCFDEVCEDNATGWKFTVETQELLFADDERGIPLTFSGMMVTELRVSGAQQPFER